ncbi:hypothetical protein DQP55_01185 [Mycolicibacterium sp. GF69]|uniref:hypothetical protein n=1 Tax=Mycolicibacterium sp. GF69 TaxID=2267251 RepID=UPI000DCDBE46|nr:hypothetical protein [Mycolicibacterium sp. GF69]RAV18126.1 hypothetical protein DQP55_01185 [Mycolicibacterium sp. GF69]
MGRHSVAKKRRTSPIGVAAVIAPAAVFFAVAGDVHFSARPAPESEPVVVEDTTPCCLEIVAAPAAPPAAAVTLSSAPDPMVAAARYRTVDRSLPVGIAPERGLQVKTILASRAISEAFPEISNIGGVRPDSLRWHPNGLALDVMIPNPSSAAGIALGDEIVSYVLRNAKRFGLQDAIWRGVYYTPDGARSGGYGHYDHVHVTTLGGGFPTGDEVYLR